MPTRQPTFFLEAATEVKRNGRCPYEKVWAPSWRGLNQCFSKRGFQRISPHYFPKADGSHERSEPWSDKARRRRLCWLFISTTPKRRRKQSNIYWETLSFSFGKARAFFEVGAGLFGPAPLQKKQSNTAKRKNQRFPKRMWSTQAGTTCVANP